HGEQGQTPHFNRGQPNALKFCLLHFIVPVGDPVEKVWRKPVQTVGFNQSRVIYRFFILFELP
ncbi:MAG TPA: hypothetical protein DEA94_11090, partial [Rhodobacteraceae bacterium]|nr:hypothetical protein [Paracoccaceae bacterium]